MPRASASEVGSVQRGSPSATGRPPDHEPVRAVPVIECTARNCPAALSDAELKRAPIGERRHRVRLVARP